MSPWVWQFPRHGVLRTSTTSWIMDNSRRSNTLARWGSAGARRNSRHNGPGVMTWCLWLTRSSSVQAQTNTSAARSPCSSHLSRGLTESTTQHTQKWRNKGLRTKAKKFHGRPRCFYFRNLPLMPHSQFAQWCTLVSLWAKKLGYHICLPFPVFSMCIYWAVVGECESTVLLKAYSSANDISIVYSLVVTVRKKWGYGTPHSKKWGYAYPLYRRKITPIVV